MGKVFISYKSNDANLVRRVVDCLVAQNVDIWFAEYEVISSNYDDFDKFLDERLAEAINIATHAVIFTNNHWDHSPHCQYERKLIFSKIAPNNIIQVCLPREEKSFSGIQYNKHIATTEYILNP